MNITHISSMVKSGFHKTSTGSETRLIPQKSFGCHWTCWLFQLCRDTAVFASANCRDAFIEYLFPYSQSPSKHKEQRSGPSLSENSKIRFFLLLIGFDAILFLLIEWWIDQTTVWRHIPRPGLQRAAAPVTLVLAACSLWLAGTKRRARCFCSASGGSKYPGSCTVSYCHQ